MFNSLIFLYMFAFFPPLDYIKGSQPIARLPRRVRFEHLTGETPFVHRLNIFSHLLRKKNPRRNFLRLLCLLLPLLVLVLHVFSICFVAHRWALLGLAHCQVAPFEHLGGLQVGECCGQKAAVEVHR